MATQTDENAPQNYQRQRSNSDPQPNIENVAVTPKDGGKLYAIFCVGFYISCWRSAECLTALPSYLDGDKGDTGCALTRGFEMSQ